MIFNRVRNRYLFLVDVALSFLAYIIVILLLWPVREIGVHIQDGYQQILATPIVYALVLLVLGIYRIDWVYASGKEYAQLIAACVIAAIVDTVLGQYLTKGAYYLKMNIAANVVVIAMTCGTRFFVRLARKMLLYSTKSSGKRTLIIGSGRLAVTLIRDIYDNEKMNYDVVGLIDDDVSRKKQSVHGVNVLGTRDDIPRICEEKRIEEIIFAIYTIDQKEKAEILDICSSTGRKVKILPGLEESLNDTGKLSTVREVRIEDLLERDSIKLENALIEQDIFDKVVMVTGGGGSIGSELCRQIIKYRPERLIILDIYENTTYELQNELEENYPNQKLDVLIASVRDKKRLNAIFEQYKPDIVFHAAAHKHVPLMEYSPMEAIKNNVFGTYNVATCAKEYGADRFVLISTDKAVNPTNVMGASKRMCEMIVQTLSRESETDFVAVRFGNVLGSNGSVIPRFKKQIAAGGPVTVTHPEITRFFMTIPEAAQLVLQAAAYAKGGEIFVLDMGKPVKIYDLARKIIKLSGLKPDVDIKIEFTGLRPGEKLYEELLMNEEGLTKTRHSKIFVGKPIDISADELKEKLDKLEGALLLDCEAVKQVVSEVVPTYVYKKKEM